MTVMTKDAVITMRLDDTDRARLDALAKHYEISMSQVVRMLAKREVEKLGLKPRSKRGTK